MHIIDKLKNINNITDPDVRKNFKLNLLQKANLVRNKKIKSDFLTFVKYIWPEFIEGNHHKEISPERNIGDPAGTAQGHDSREDC